MNSEVAVVERVKDTLADDLAEVVVVHDKSGRGVDASDDSYVSGPAMSMQTRTFAWMFREHV